MLFKFQRLRKQESLDSDASSFFTVMGCEVGGVKDDRHLDVFGGLRGERV